MTVCNLCLWWRRKVIEYISKCSIVYWSNTDVLHFVTSNILCSSLVNPYYTKMTIHSIFTFQFIPYGHFTCSPAYCISSKQSDLYIETFSTSFRVKTLFLILLQLDIFCTREWNDTMLKTTIHHTRVTCLWNTGVHGSKKSLLPSNSHLNLVNSILCRALQSKLYRQDFWDVDHLTCVLSHCWLRRR